MNGEVELELNPKQWEVDTATEPEIFYISGVGGGKSFELGQWVLERASIPASIGLLAAPTYDVMRQSTLPQVQESWAKVGIFEDVHYVVNVLPPASWNVKPFSSLNNSRVITFSWGSYVILDTLEKINKARGTEYDYIAVDEFRDVKFSGVRKVLIARLRGREFKRLGKTHQLLWVSTPPDDVEELNEIVKKPNVKLVEGTSYDNEHNLPKNYIQGLEAQYDPLTAAREIHGSRKASKKGKPFMYCFDDDKHISVKAIWNPKLTTYLSFDFNVNPMTCSVEQHGIHPNGKRWIWFVGEVFIENGDIEDVCLRLLSDYPNAHFRVTGDRSGLNRTGLNKNINYYRLIKKYLRLSVGQFKVVPNPFYEKNIVLCNSILSKYDEVLFHPVKCKQTIWDMHFVQWDGKKPVKEDRKKKEQRADLFDCVRYQFNTWHHEFLKNVR